VNYKVCSTHSINNWNSEDTRCSGKNQSTYFRYMISNGVTILNKLVQKSLMGDTDVQTKG
jgi:hypothetical protein